METFHVHGPSLCGVNLLTWWLYLALMKNQGCFQNSKKTSCGFNVVMKKKCPTVSYFFKNGQKNVRFDNFWMFRYDIDIDMDARKQFWDQNLFFNFWNISRSRQVTSHNRNPDYRLWSIIIDILKICLLLNLWQFKVLEVEIWHRLFFTVGWIVTNHSKKLSQNSTIFDHSKNLFFGRDIFFVTYYDDILLWHDDKHCQKRSETREKYSGIFLSHT